MRVWHPASQKRHVDEPDVEIAWLPKDRSQVGVWHGLKERLYGKTRPGRVAFLSKGIRSDLARSAMPVLVVIVVE